MSNLQTIQKGNVMKKVVIVLSLLTVAACNQQQPTSEAPVYNITLTDNSQWVLGNNNATDSKSETKSDNTSKPSADAESADKDTSSNMWLFWLVMVAALGAGGYFVYRKYIK